MRDRWDEEDELGRGRERAGRSEPDPEPTLGELIDGSVRKLVTGLVIAGALIGLAIWSRPSPGHYQAVAADGR